jgi:hypothetical protein
VFINTKSEKKTRTSSHFSKSTGCDGVNASFRKDYMKAKNLFSETRILLCKSLFLQSRSNCCLFISACGIGADEKENVSVVPFVLSSVFYSRNCTNLQENHNLFNECLPDLWRAIQILQRTLSQGFRPRFAERMSVNHAKLTCELRAH